MKYIKTTALTLIAALSFSCQSWLDVEPRTEVHSDKMFRTEQGFKNAITGCYMLMTADELYGKDLTAGFMEIAGHQFSTQNDANNPYYSIIDLDWEDGIARPMIDKFWSGMYNVVANVNNIIENIDKRKDVLHPTSHGIIKGEAYGLRGFLHFELLRMFGYGDVVRHPEYMDKMSIPYSLSYNKEYAEQYAQKDAIRLAIEDLETSIELLEAFDPWATSGKAPDYYLSNDDGFFTNRATRFNYWAAKATLARIYVWAGEYDKALPILENFIGELGDIDGLRWIEDRELANVDERYKDMTFSMEHIFRLDVNELWERIERNYDPDYTELNSSLFYLTQDEMKELFQVPDDGLKPGLSDYRYVQQLDKTGDRVSVKKFIDYENKEYANRMPVIKIAEMYYMAAECMCHEDRKDDAIELMNQVWQHRNIPPMYWLPEDMSANEVMAEIAKEWKREFLGEGQMFYYYKRTGSPTMGTYPIKDQLKVYVFPIPEIELNTGGRVNNVPEEEENE